MSAFFFLGPRFDLGTASMDSAVREADERDGSGAAAAAAGVCRRALKEEMKSTASGESPSRLLK